MDRAALVLFIVVDVLGAVGAVLVALPLLREYGLKRLRDAFRTGPAIRDFDAAEAVALNTVEAELGRFKPGDRALVGWGLVAIAASYALHIAAELIEHFAR